MVREDRVRYTDNSDQYKAMCQIVEDLQNGIYDRRTLEDAAEIITEAVKYGILETKSHLANLISHILKWEYQPSRRSKSWLRTIDNSLTELEEIFNVSRSLKNEVREMFDQVYKRAKRAAEIDTSIKMPNTPPHTFDEYVNREFVESIVNKDDLRTNNYYRKIK